MKITLNVLNSQCYCSNVNNNKGSDTVMLTRTYDSFDVNNYDNESVKNAKQNGASPVGISSTCFHKPSTLFCFLYQIHLRIIRYKRKYRQQFFFG